jgi:hypothetical protein
LHGQEIDFDLRNVKFKGIEFSATREKIINAFGQGKRVETNYECGFFTNDQERGPYYQLVYVDFDYIGSDKDKFFLQHVTFDTKGEIKIDYRDKELSGQTTKDDFVKIFGDKVSEYFEKYPDKSSILIYSKGSDDGAIFTFKDNKLSKFEYWTPC